MWNANRELQSHLCPRRIRSPAFLAIDSELKLHIASNSNVNLLCSRIKIVEAASLLQPLSISFPVRMSHWARNRRFRSWLLPMPSDLFGASKAFSRIVKLHYPWLLKLWYGIGPRLLEKGWQCVGKGYSIPHVTETSLLGDHEWFQDFCGEPKLPLYREW